MFSRSFAIIRFLFFHPRPSSNKPSSSHQDEAEDRLGVIYQAVGDVINIRNNRAPISESQPSINALTEASDNVFDE